MSKKIIKKRVNKSKKEIVSQMQLVDDANRRRALIKDVIFPYILELNDTIGYSKVFIQALSGMVNGVFDDTRKSTTVGHISDSLIAKLDSIFNKNDVEQKKEYDRYVTLVGKLKDISIQDLTYALELPRFIDGYTTKNIDKGSISTIDINAILG